jgi:hypothetical protein
MNEKKREKPLDGPNTRSTKQRTTANEPAKGTKKSTSNSTKKLPAKKAKVTKEKAAISTMAAANQSTKVVKNSAGISKKAAESVAKNYFPVQVTVNGDRPLGLTVYQKENSYFLIVNAVTPGEQCVDKIHTSDQVIYVDDQLIMNKSKDEFLRLLDSRKVDKVVYTVTFLRYSPLHHNKNHSLQVLMKNAIEAMNALGVLNAFIKKDENELQILRIEQKKKVKNVSSDFYDSDDESLAEVKEPTKGTKKSAVISTTAAAKKPTSTKQRITANEPAKGTKKSTFNSTKKLPAKKSKKGTKEKAAISTDAAANQSTTVVKKSVGISTTVVVNQSTKVLKKSAGISKKAAESVAPSSAFASGSVNKVINKRGMIDPEPSSAFLSGKINLKRKQFVGQVIKILRKMYKKRAKRVGRDLFKDKSTDDVIFDEINKHGCHTMTVIDNGRRVVKAAIIAERVERKPDNEMVYHFGFCIRFMSEPDEYLQCLLHRICSMILWDNKLDSRNRITHIYLRYKSGISLECPKFFMMTISEDAQQAFCIKYGFREEQKGDQAVKMDPPDDLWIEDGQVYIPVALDIFEKKFRNNKKDAMYRHCAGEEELLTSPFVYASHAVKAPPPSNSFFYIDPHSIDEFCVRYVNEEDIDTADVFAHNKFLGWRRIDLGCFDTSKKIKSDLQAVSDDVIRDKNRHVYQTYTPRRAGAANMMSSHSHSCAWVSTMKLLLDSDKKTVTEMKVLLEKYPERYNDLRITKASKIAGDEWTLAMHMNTWNYYIQKVTSKKDDGLSLHESLLTNVFGCGLFLCLLTDDNGQSTHVVGVQMELGKVTIFDSELETTIPVHDGHDGLTAFHTCLGFNKSCIGIKSVWKIIPQMNKKNP